MGTTPPRQLGGDGQTGPRGTPQTRLDKNVYSEETSGQTGQKCPARVDTNGYPDRTNMSTNNIESNRETNREISNSKIAPLEPSSISTPSSEEDIAEELISPQLELLIETCSREFDDFAPPSEHWPAQADQRRGCWPQRPCQHRP